MKDPAKVNSSYRDNVWQGSDLLATGVASFGHISGVTIKPSRVGRVRRCLGRGRLPLGRALRPTEEQALIREVILQLKRGYLDPTYFADKYGVDIHQKWGRCLGPIRAGRVLCCALVTRFA